MNDPYININETLTIFNMDHLDPLEILDTGAVCRIDPMPIPDGLKLSDKCKPFKLCVLARDIQEFPDFMTCRLPNHMSDFIGDALIENNIISRWVYISGVFYSDDDFDLKEAK